MEQEYRFEQVFPGQMNELGKNGNKPATGNLAGYDQTQQPEEPMGHEWLERFLDADRPEDQLAVLKQMEGHVTQKRTGLYLSVFGPAVGNRKDKNRAGNGSAPPYTAAAPV